MASVPGNFTVDLSGGYYMDPNTGEIVDSASGQTFANADDLEGYSQTFAQEEASQGNGMSGALGGGSAISAAYLASQLAPKAGAGAASAGATAANTAANTAASTSASSAASAGAVEAGSNAGVLLSTGEVIPVGAAIPEGATAIGSAPLPASSMLSTAGPYAAALAAIYGTAAGVDSGLDDWRNGEKQSGAIRATNAIASPATGIMGQIGGPFKSDKAASIAGLMIGNPLAALDLAGVNLWSGKDKDQLARDRARKGQQKDGEIDDKFIATLSSGATHDFGKDGKHMLTNSDGSKRHYYDVDFSREDSGQLAAMLDPIGLARGGSRKTGSDMTGNYVNLAQNAGNSLENVREIYGRYDYNTLRSIVDGSDIAQADKDAMFNTLDDVYGVNAYAGKGSAFDRGGLSSAAPMGSRPAQAPKPPAAPSTQPQVPKPAVKPMTPGGVQLTQGPRPQPMGNQIPRLPSPTMPQQGRAPVPTGAFAGAKTQVSKPAPGVDAKIPRFPAPRNAGASAAAQLADAYMKSGMQKPRFVPQDDPRKNMIPRLGQYQGRM